jgi:hypothetical protein
MTNEQPPIMPPKFLQSAPLKVWRSQTGFCFLRSEALQTGGMLLSAQNGHLWHLYAPCDGDQWAGILCGLANDMQEAFTAAVQAMPTANSQPT